MPKEHSQFNDHYIQHLIALAPSFPITVTSEIWSAERSCLLSAGDYLDEVRLQQLIGCDLVVPVAMSIEIEGSFSAQALLASLERECLMNAAIAEVYRQVDIREHLDFACKKVAEQPSLLQYLWVMSHRLPQTYARALFCAWAATAISRQNGKPEEQISDAFIAGLSHDIGLLFVPENATKVNQQDLSPEQWAQLKPHPQIGSELLLFLPSMSSQVSRAVQEHHEELDGSGYPAGKIAKQLGPLGRLIHVLDSVYAIFIKFFQPRGRTLNDVIPILQMNQLSAPGQPGADLIVLLRMATPTTSCSVPDDLMPLLIQQIQRRHTYIKGFVAEAEVFVEQHQTSIANARLFSLARLLDHIVVAMNQSGLINDAYMRFLQQVETERLEHYYREVEDAFLMTQEVLYHIQRFVLRMIDLLGSGANTVTELTPIWAPKKSISLIDVEAPAQSKASTQKALKTMGESAMPTMPSELEDLWLTHVRKLQNI